MKNIPITLSLPEEMVKDLHLYIPRRQISRFVVEMVKEGLEHKKELIAQEFREASLDKEREEEIEFWDKAIGDGLSEENSY